MNIEPDLAGKITGMLLEMSEGDVIGIIEDHMACQEKVRLFHWPIAVLYAFLPSIPSPHWAACKMTKTCRKLLKGAVGGQFGGMQCIGSNTAWELPAAAVCML